MNVVEFTALIFAGSVAAGFLGALTGLGGGVVIVPLLTIVFGVDIRYAIGAALVSVIATSSGAAAAYVREGYSNVRVGMFLEIATTLGALAGTVVAVYLHASAIAIVFGVVLIYSAYASLKAGAAFGRRFGGGPVGNAIEDGQQLSDRAWIRELSRARSAGWVCAHVCGGRAVGIVGDWVGGGEGSGDGSRDEIAVQGVDDNIKFHDWRNGGGGRGNLFEPRIYRSRIGDAGDAGSFAGVDFGRADFGGSAGARFAMGVQRSDWGFGVGDDLWGSAGEILERGEIGFAMLGRLGLRPGGASPSPTG